eukprot:2255163-Amphidinium_carterae.1
MLCVAVWFENLGLSGRKFWSPSDNHPTIASKPRWQGHAGPTDVRWLRGIVEQISAGTQQKFMLTHLWDAVVVLATHGESKFLAAYVAPACVDLDVLKAECQAHLAIDLRLALKRAELTVSVQFQTFLILVIALRRTQSAYGELCKSVEAWRPFGLESKSWKAKLAHYMVPSTFTKLEHMPVTDRGKLDKKALPKPDAKASHSEMCNIEFTPKRSLDRTS